MQKVLLLIDDMGQGGAERQMAYLAMAYKKSNFDVRLIRFYDNRIYYEKDLIKNGINIETAKCGKSTLKRPFFIAKTVKDWEPDVVITYKDGPCMAACIARFFIRFKLIVSERNTTQHLTFREKIKLQLYRKADRIVPNSQSQAKFIETYAPWLSHKTSIITNMIDVNKFSPAYNQHRRENIPTIITTARLSPQKNVINYLKSIKLLKDDYVEVHFDWYGNVEDKEYFNQIKKEIKHLNIGDYITFHNGIDNIEDIYKQADYFCLPSIFEGFPNVLCEAMASGLVCIASDICDNTYIISDEKMRFDPSSPEQIKEKINYLLNLPKQEKINISQQNRNTVIELCSEKSFISKYKSL